MLLHDDETPKTSTSTIDDHDGRATLRRSRPPHVEQVLNLTHACDERPRVRARVEGRAIGAYAIGRKDCDGRMCGAIELARTDATRSTRKEQVVLLTWAGGDSTRRSSTTIVIIIIASSATCASSAICSCHKAVQLRP